MMVKSFYNGIMLMPMPVPTLGARATALPLLLYKVATLEIQYIAVRYFAISSISRIVRGPQIYHDHKKKKK